MEEFSRELPDLGGAAVRALPSDLTEREEIDLLCQVETYMTVTDKHSQTHPEAGAEEARIYSLVNGLIAKRFSDIGAAVRGEAVAEFTYKGPDGRFLDSGEWWVENSEIGNHMALPILRNGKTIALVFSEAHDDCKQEIEENCRLLCSAGNSAGAADAPSEPSELLIFSEKGDLMQELESVLMENNWRGDLVERIRKSRAADALDSQPTEPVACGACHGSGRMVRDADIGTDQECFSCDGSGESDDASSQPTDGGVRNAS